MARLQQKMQAAGTTGLAATSGLPRAMALRLIRDLLGAPGFLATITSAMREHHRQLGISVGMPGPHDFAVRIVLFVGARRTHAATTTRPPHPIPNVRDDRETPLLIGHGTRALNINF
jgi:hypothetical protein